MTSTLTLVRSHGHVVDILMGSRRVRWFRVGVRGPIVVTDDAIRSGRPTPLLDLIAAVKPDNEVTHVIPRLGVSWEECYENPTEENCVIVTSYDLSPKDRPGRPYKLSVKDMLYMVSTYWGGFKTQADLMKEYRVSRQLVGNIVNGRHAWFVL